MQFFVLDPHPVVSDMLSMLILRVNPNAVIYTARTVRQLNGLLKKQDQPDFIFIEPQLNGFSDEIGENQFNQKSKSTKIIAFTDIHLIGISASHLKNNFEYIIDKNSSTSEILIYLDNLITPSFTNSQTIIGKSLKISKRHRQLIQFLAKGLTNREIAENLDISENTVKVHFFRLFKILNVHNRLQALNFLKKNGFIL